MVLLRNVAFAALAVAAFLALVVVVQADDPVPGSCRRVTPVSSRSEF